jgi:hypothetical protein
MSDQGMLTSIDEQMLAEAFSVEYQSESMSAGMLRLACLRHDSGRSGFLSKFGLNEF